MGFECAAGWYALLRDCCLRITEEYEQAGREIDFIPLQIKEKFGTLRFYYGFKDFPQSISAIDFLDSQSLRFSPSNQQDDEEIALLRQAIDDIISETKEQSKQICEFCGEKGSLRQICGGKKRYVIIVIMNRFRLSNYANKIEKSLGLKIIKTNLYHHMNNTG